MQTTKVYLFIAFAFYLAAPVAAQPLIAPTEPLTPAEQKKKFKLPPGFEIQLVASEPDIQKPMNLNFDARGQLWVTHTVEYPFPAEDADKARDGLTILSDIGDDGRARKVTRFADKLNIPIGIVPIKAGREAIVWSIPHIWKLTDTDGDDKADQREIIYGPFGVDDTHGNQNAFTRGLDGWIYACHGFRNHSKVKLRGEGDVAVEMQSGHTYRFKPDGSAIEIYTHGQVNPFGLCFDPWGNLWSADCHSKPVTMLLRGAYYQSFGKPHDGLGFAPHATNDNHGSTGIAGIAYYAAEHFPREYRDCIYVGNVITNRVHRDVIEWRGSTPWIEKPQDFLTCDDPWFRPVDIQLGPDGALYIADFYNCIIGHYEVPLDHPKRDRTRGRIWRVVWKGTDATDTAKPARVEDFTTARVERVVEQLGNDNLTARRLAAFAMMDRLKKDEANRLSAALWPKLFAAGSSPESVVGMLWVLHRFDRLPLDSTDWFHAGGDSDLVRAHLARLLAEMHDLSAINAVNALLAGDAQAARAVTELMARHTWSANIPRLLALLRDAEDGDLALLHATRIALRDQLRASEGLEAIDRLKLEDGDLQRLADIALAVPTEAAAHFTFEYIRKHDVPAERLDAFVAHVTANLPAGRVDDVVAFARQRFKEDVDRQVALLLAVHQAAAARGVKAEAGSAVGEWLGELVGQVVDGAKPRAAAEWRNVGVAGMAASRSPWGVTHRGSTDGDASAKFFDSIVHGEQLTGVLRSRAFEIPAKLSFWMCGHNGFPNTDPPPANHIHLKLAETGEVIAKEIPPRHDTARKYTWDLSKWAGKRGVIEIVDANTLNAYAWIGVGRFDPPVVRVTETDPAQRATREAALVRLIGEYRLPDARATLLKVLADGERDEEVRLAALEASMQLGAVGEGDGVGQASRLSSEKAFRTAVTDWLRSEPAATQRRIALALCAQRDGATLLTEAIATGKASPRLLQDQQVRQRFDGVADAALKQQANELVRGLPSPDESIAKLIVARAAGFAAASPSAERGKALFTQHCAACHRIGDEGATVGPQLDGIGARGPARLLEDLLDPSRNVDEAFRTTIYRTADGGAVTGLELRREGNVIVYADATGKEQRLSADDVASTRTSKLSPMPSNVGELMNEAELYDLLAFLLAQREGTD